MSSTLSALKVAKLNKPGRYRAAKNLWLQITPRKVNGEIARDANGAIPVQIERPRAGESQASAQVEGPH
jgi:hypothetical protein